jgi:hypothetical protein
MKNRLWNKGRVLLVRVQGMKIMSYSTNMRRLHRVSVDRVAIVVVLDPNFKHATVGVDEHSNHKVSQNAWNSRVSLAKQPCHPSEGSCTC